MDKKEASCRLGTVGGQAVIEGVMMKNKGRYSLAVRMPDGSIQVHNDKFVSVRAKHKWMNLPLVRGVVNFVEMMCLSFKTLSISADAYASEENEKGEQNGIGEKAMGWLMALSTVLGLALAVGLFILLPTYITKGIDYLAGGRLGFWGNLIEGLVKIAIFIGYLLSVSFMKDIRRTFEYHGAEHKSIYCYEAGEELTPENVRRHIRFHPRCGTSFLFVMVLLSIFISALPFMPTWDNSWLRACVKLCMLPLIMGLGYEFIFYAGKHDNFLVRALSAPGLWMQRITTREPDDAQITIAICALKSALPEVFGTDIPELAEAVIFEEGVQVQPSPEEAKSEGETEAATDDGAGQ